MSLDDFIFGKLLGKGSFSLVNIVTRKQDKKQYAMKRVYINNLSEKEKLSSLNEIRILSSLNHPNIIGYKEAFFDSKTRTLNIVMEYADDGDLLQKIKNNLKNHLHFAEKTIWDWFIQILEGLKYLHDNKIMHRDLKSANIFINKNGILKIGDLNVSIIAKMGLAKTRTGTPYYCSPEIWKDLSYDYKSDVWSLGCIIYELCMLKPPFRGTSLKELCFNVIKGHYLPIINYYSDDLRQIISRMLVVNPNKRATIDELLFSDILQKRIAMARKNIITNEIKNGKKSKKVNFMETIKLPRNFKEINNKLPKKRYKAEDEMMENDEYETMKATFFHEMKNQMDKREEKIIYKNNVDFRENENINNYIRKNNNLNKNRQFKNNNKYENMIENNNYKEIYEINKNIKRKEEHKNYINYYANDGNKNYNKKAFYNQKINYNNNENNINRNMNKINRNIENNKIRDFNNIPNKRLSNNIYAINKNENVFNNFENKDNNIDLNEFQQKNIYQRNINKKQIKNIDNNSNNENNQFNPKNKSKENIKNYNYKLNNKNIENNNKKIIEIECEKTKQLQKMVSRNQNLLDDLLYIGNSNNNQNIKENELFKINIPYKNNENIIKYKKLPYQNNKVQIRNKVIKNKINNLEERKYNNHKRVITPDNIRKNNLFDNYNNNQYNNISNKYYNNYSYQNSNKRNNGKNKRHINDVREQFINNPKTRASNDNIRKNNNFKIKNENDGYNNHAFLNIYYSKKNNINEKNSLNYNRNNYIKDPKSLLINNKINYSNNYNFNNNFHVINNCNNKYNLDYKNNMANKNELINNYNYKVNGLDNNNYNINNFNNYYIENKYKFKKPTNKITYGKINYNDYNRNKIANNKNNNYINNNFYFYNNNKISNYLDFK